MSADISDHVRSQDSSDRNLSTRSRQPGGGGSSARAIASMKSSGPSAISTSSCSPYGRTTSRTEVDTTGRPAARYSGVLVGLMNFVESFFANGSSATSHPERYEGSSPYFFIPR